ncbi:MerR family transcriptional regulator [Streptomyces sp. H27-C3]|uniref:MerR family transcriptional regulator n=1 Tax=Streptomyces sp. H27-C3 TaxID=3046305 RepID=UPI0024B8F75F|nr:MerR family transcriptional regulator [Streptomyces sp. H27-C3]MDJ0460663.1 MerR family transcriptional regulator [Streptomyces sp. H27-C3]
MALTRQNSTTRHGQAVPGRNPTRSVGGQRRYSRREIDRVAEAVDLIDEGVTLVGVRHVLTLRARVAVLEAELRGAHG